MLRIRQAVDIDEVRRLHVEPLRVLFMSCTKPAVVPPTRSASATVASFPDCTIIPLIRSMTGTWLPTLTKVREPPVRQAASLIVTWSFELQPAVPERREDHV